MWVGTPPSKFSVITDTGSTLLAFPCKACTQCGTHERHRYDPLVSSTSHKVPCGGGCRGTCNSAAQQCAYTQSYTEGSSLRGLYYSDQVWIGADVAAPAAAESATFGIPFTFGCHTYENGLFTSQLADGIMGLGRDGQSIIAALHGKRVLDKQLFSMCLSLQGGALALGGIDTAHHKEPVAWQAFSTSSGFYTVRVTEVTAAGQHVSGGASAIVDSGTSFTYLPASAFSSMQSKLQSAAGAVAGATKTNVQGEGLCYTFSNAAQQLAKMPGLSIKVGAVTFDVAPEHVWFNMAWDGPSAFCLGVYNNGGSSGVIGANAMMGYDVVFDLESNRLGLAKSDCVTPTAAGDIGGAVAPPSPSAVPPSPSKAAAASPSKAAVAASKTPAGAFASATPVAFVSASASPAAVQDGDTQAASSPVANLDWQSVSPGSVFTEGFFAGLAALLAVVMVAAGCVSCRRGYCSAGGLVIMSTRSQLWISLVDSQNRTVAAVVNEGTQSKFSDRNGEDVVAPGEIELGSVLPSGTAPQRSNEGASILAAHDEEAVLQQAVLGAAGHDSEGLGVETADVFHSDSD